jgi:hypothetical protein
MRLILASLAMTLMIGCGPAPDEEVSAQQPIDTQEPPSPSGGSACNTGVVETILPGQQGVTVVTLCKSCDRGCDEDGLPCSKYGDSCDFYGERGVCAACCDGERGRLRCHPVD